MEYSWLTKLFVTGSCPPRKSKPSCRMTLPVFSTHLSFYVYDVDAWVEVEKEMPPARLIDSLSRNRKQFRRLLQPVQRPFIASLEKLRKYTPCGTFWQEVILFPSWFSNLSCSLGSTCPWDRLSGLIHSSLVNRGFIHACLAQLSTERAR